MLIALNCLNRYAVLLILLLAMLPPVAVIAQTAAEALHFDGLDDRVTGTNTSLPQGNNPRTIEAWVKYNANNISVFNYGTETTNQLFSVAIYQGVYIVGLNNDFQTNSGLNYGVWHHIAVTHDGTTTTVYVNGVSVGTRNTTYNTTGTAFQISSILRSGGNYTNHYLGNIDEVRIWNVARTQAEIQANMNAELSSGTGLIAAYHFNQGIEAGNNSGVTTLLDALGAANGTLQNFSLSGSTSNWVASGFSVTKFWTGAASGEWGTAANWSSGVVPLTTDNVTLPSSGVANEVTISTSVAVGNLTMSTGRTITLTTGGSLTVNGTLLMNGGNITLNNQSMAFGSSSAVSGAGAGKAIVTNGTGKVSRSIAGGTSFQFPVGASATTYNPLTIELQSGDPTESFSVNVTPLTGASPGFGTTDTSLAAWRVWDITEGSSGGNHARLTFQWSNDEDGSNIGPPTLLGAYRYNSGTGRYQLIDVATGVGGNPIVVQTSASFAVTTFSSWIVGANGALPVQIASFTGVFVNNTVRLQWRTISEINNYGFYVQRKLQSDSVWTELPNSFIAGHGTTNEPREYSFVDESAPRASLEYRLRQVDLDGTVHYTDPISVSGVTSVGEKEIPQKYSLSQNYPNPFNPSTTIAFGLPKASHVKLEVYNALGQKVAELVNGTLEAGYYAERFDATGLSTGLYIYRLQAGDFVHVRKLVVLK